MCYDKGEVGRKGKGTGEAFHFGIRKLTHELLHWHSETVK